MIKHGDSAKSGVERRLGPPCGVAAQQDGFPEGGGGVVCCLLLLLLLLARTEFNFHEPRRGSPFGQRLHGCVAGGVCQLELVPLPGRRWRLFADSGGQPFRFWRCWLLIQPLFFRSLGPVLIDTRGVEGRWAGEN